MTPEANIALIGAIEALKAQSNASSVDDRLIRLEDRAVSLETDGKDLATRVGRGEEDIGVLKKDVKAAELKIEGLTVTSGEHDRRLGVREDKAEELSGEVTALKLWKPDVEKGLGQVPGAAELGEMVDKQVNRWALIVGVAGALFVFLAFFVGQSAGSNGAVAPPGQTPDTAVSATNAPPAPDDPNGDGTAGR